MDTNTLNIPEPCHESWNGMDGDERKRFCKQCDKHVHNLSGMAQDEAQALLDSTSNLCVLYSSNDQGDVLFRDSSDPQWRLRLQFKGAQRLVQAAALVLPMMLAGCLPQENPQPEVIAPLVMEDGKGVKVGVSSTPPEQPSPPEHEIVDSQGMLMEPDEPAVVPAVLPPVSIRARMGKRVAQPVRQRHTPTPPKKHTKGQQP